ncbi:hypothetical protein [Vibrio phage Va2]|nr:hypothetical protein [Vibrio phage Va2]
MCNVGQELLRARRQVRNSLRDIYERQISEDNNLLLAEERDLQNRLLTRLQQVGFKKILKELK